MLMAIPVISKVLEQTTLEETMLDASWCLSYISDAGQSTIPVIMETGITPKIINLTMNGVNSSLCIPSLRTIGNFVTGSDE